MHTTAMSEVTQGFMFHYALSNEYFFREITKLFFKGPFTLDDRILIFDILFFENIISGA